MSTNQVKEFLKSIPDEQKRADSVKLDEILREATGETPYMWNANIIGYGSYHYKYESGREGDAVIVGFSPRKNALTIYGVIYDQKTELLDQLGVFKQGKGCLYIKQLSDINIAILKEMVIKAYQQKTSKSD